MPGSCCPEAHVRVLVAGDGADNLTKQTGGWTLSWQGTGTKPADFPHAQSIWSGIAEQVKAAGGSATLSVDGRFTIKPDVAVVVFGEDPYAEFQGDRPDVGFDDARSLATLRRSRRWRSDRGGVPVGRAMWVNPFLNAADAFVAAWLPGSEGGGIAEVLFGKADFRGTLPYSWPRSSDQTAVNVGDKDYNPLFPYGFGLKYGQNGDLAPLPEARATVAAADPGVLFAAGRPGAGRRCCWARRRAVHQSGPELIDARPADHRAQEDRCGCTGRARSGHGRDCRGCAHQSDAREQWRIGRRAGIPHRCGTHGRCEPDDAMQGPKCAGGFPVGAMFRAAAQTGQWSRLAIPLHCFEKAGVDMSKVTVPIALSTSGAMTVTLSSARIVSPVGPVLTCK
jgi:beta-glucosidase